MAEPLPSVAAMKLFARSLFAGLLCTAALLFLPPAGERPQAGALPIAQHLLKLDGLLRNDVNRRSSEKRRVLIRTRPSDRQALKQQLESQGLSVLGAFDSGDTLNVIVPGDALESVAKLNRVLKGVTTIVATASYSGGGQHRWFDVQLIQRQLRTTVKVNGVTVFNEVPQPDAGGASLGLATHWAKANFDNIFVTELPPAP